MRGGDVELKPRNLWYVERVSHDQVAVPDTRLGHDYDGLNLGRENPRVERPSEEPSRPVDSDDDMSESGSSEGVHHDQEHDWGLGEQTHEAPPAWEVDSRRGIARAIGGALGTDHNATELFRHLHRNGRDPQAVQALEHAFHAEHGGTLAEALTFAHENGHLSETEYQHALGLLGHGNTMFANPADDVRVTSTAGLNPSAHSSVRDVATALRRNMELGQHDETLALLSGVNRDMRATWAVHDAYHEMYGTQLNADLTARMPGEHQAYLNHLLGDVSDHAVPEALAHQWYRELEHATFQHEMLGELPIPTGHPEDGCYLRAHLWALRLHQLGAPVAKIFVARANPLLSIRSATAAGGTREHPVEVNWGYHVAPVVRVRDGAGNDVWAVFDPAMRSGVMTAQEWINRTGVPGHVEPIVGSLPEISDMLRQNSVDHPDWWTPAGTQRLPMGAVSVITDVHGYGSRTRTTASTTASAPPTTWCG